LTAAVALKAANAGTAPVGIHVLSVQHVYWNHSQSTNVAVQNMSTGNLKAMETVLASNNMAVTGSISGAWAGRVQENDGGSPYAGIWDLVGGSPGSENLSIGFSGTSGVDGTALFFDITGAASSPYDTSAGANGSSSNDALVYLSTVSITPSTNNGLALGCVGFQYGGADGGVGIQNLTLYQNPVPTYDVNGNVAADNVDGFGLYYNPNTSSVTFAWDLYALGSTGVGTWFAAAAAYKAAAGPSANIQQATFEFRNDNGSESAATALAAQGTNITGPAGQNIRIRVQIASTGGDPGAQGFQLEYNYNNRDWIKT